MAPLESNHLDLKRAGFPQHPKAHIDFGEVAPVAGRRGGRRGGEHCPGQDRENVDAQALTRPRTGP
jgi:hypothetical protein